MTDFKITSIINAATANFPGIEIKSCFYHLSENFWKRNQQAELQERYTDKEDFANALHIVAPGNVVV